MQQTSFFVRVSYCHAEGHYSYFLLLTTIYFEIFQYVNQTFPREDTSTNFLPHISERELPDGKWCR